MSRILRFLFPTTRYTARASLFLLALRVLSREDLALMPTL